MIVQVKSLPSQAPPLFFFTSSRFPNKTRLPPRDVLTVDRIRSATGGDISGGLSLAAHKSVTLCAANETEASVSISRILPSNSLFRVQRRLVPAEQTQHAARHRRSTEASLSIRPVSF